jgi:hypothetical protein
VTNNIALVAEWGEDFSIRHLVMPDHLECCTYTVLEWIAEYVPAAPVNVMAQFHPDNFCDPASDKYPEKYAEIAHRPTRTVPRLRNLKRRSSKRLMRRFNKAGQQGGQALLLDAEYASREAIDSADRSILPCLSSLPHDFHNHPLVPLPIKLGIKDPLPSPQIEFAAGNGHYDLR